MRGGVVRVGVVTGGVVRGGVATGGVVTGGVVTGRAATRDFRFTPFLSRNHTKFSRFTKFWANIYIFTLLIRWCCTTLRHVFPFTKIQFWKKVGTPINF